MPFILVWYTPVFHCFIRVLKEDAITGKVHKNLQRIVESYAR